MDRRIERRGPGCDCATTPEEKKGPRVSEEDLAQKARAEVTSFQQTGNKFDRSSMGSYTLVLIAPPKLILKITQFLPLN